MTRTKSSSMTVVLLCAASAFALSACGGGSSSSGGVSAASAPPPSNGAFSLRSTANVRSQITGTALRETGPNLQLTSVSGTFDHATSAITLNDGQFAFADPTGVDQLGVHQDGSASLLLLNRTSAPFDFVNLYVQEYTLNGQLFESVGVVGVASNISDIPATGKATFNGDAFGAIRTNASNTIQSFSGDSLVEADFGLGLTDVTFSNLVDIDTNGSVALVDTIKIDNMAITGNTFSGGTLVTTNGGAAVNITGGNTTTVAQGHFFGPSGSVPDEVGGNLLSVGNTRTLATTFLAD